MNRRPLARIEHAELDAGLIGVDAHFAAQRIELTDQMAFGRPAYRRVAGHHGDIIHGQRGQQRAAANTGSSQSCLDTGMTGTNYNHIVAIRYEHIFIQNHQPSFLFANTELRENLIDDIFSHCLACEFTEFLPG